MTFYLTPADKWKISDFPDNWGQYTDSFGNISVVPTEPVEALTGKLWLFFSRIEEGFEKRNIMFLDAIHQLAWGGPYAVAFWEMKLEFEKDSHT